MVPGCKKNTPDKNEEPLARVYDKYLYGSDIEGLLHEGISAEDSAQIVDDFIDNWMRRNLILKVAEDNVQGHLDEIDKQVQDSREALIISAYERQWLRQNLDTIVAFDSVRKYFDDNQQDFILKSDIYKLSYAIVPSSVKSADSIKYWYAKGVEKYQSALERYCSGNCTGYSINSGKWLSEDDLFNLLPYDLYAGGRFRTKGVVEWSDDESRYLVKVDEFYKAGEIGPFEYYQEQVKDIIIHKRKTEMVKNIYQQIYSEGLKHNNAEIIKPTE